MEIIKFEHTNINAHIFINIFRKSEYTLLHNA